MGMANLITGQNENSVIFLLGAGASVDAGLPTIAQLTKVLKDGLPTLTDVNGKHWPEFKEIFDLIEKNDDSVANNYERFFEWISLLLRVAKDPFRKLVYTNLATSTIDAIANLASIVGAEIARILSSYSNKSEYNPDYLARLRDFLPDKGRLKVFTLNYDCCVENACHTAGIDITTGFDSITKKWNPLSFNQKVSGINLYKLHGSLHWFPVRNKPPSQHRLSLMELTPPGEHPPTSADPGVSKNPELVLGPDNKVQHDDPFLALFYEFRKSMFKAKMCVVIGFGYGDPHISDIIYEALDENRLSVLDVNLKEHTSSYLDNPHYHSLHKSAKDALLEGWIARYLSKLCRPSKETERGHGSIADNF
jgi:hypothetical protein